MALSKFETYEPSRPVRLNSAQRSRINTARRIVTVEPLVFLYIVTFVSTNVINIEYVTARFASDGIADHLAGQNHTPRWTTLENETETNRNGVLLAASDIALSNLGMDGETTLFLLYYNMLGMLPGVLLAMFAGPYSDKQGRKLLLRLPLIGVLCRLAINLLVAVNSYNIQILYIGVAIDGILGGPSIFNTAAYSYIADVTEAKSRSQKMYGVAVCNLVALGLGLCSMGYLLAAVGYMYTYMTLICFGVLGLLYATCWIEESITEKQKADFFCLENLKIVATILCHDDGSKRTWKIKTGLAIVFIHNMVDLGVPYIIILFLVGPGFAFTADQVGLFLGLAFGLEALGTSLLICCLYQHIGDLKVIMIATLSGLTGYFWYGSPFITVDIIFVGPLFLCLSPLTDPMVRGYLSKLVAAEDQGALASGLSISCNGSAFVGSVFFGMIYALTARIYAGFTFLLCAFLYLITFMLAIYMWIRNRHEEKASTSPTETTILTSGFMQGDT